MSNPTNNEERIVMTPSKKSHGHTTIRMERVKPTEMDNSSVMHVAGGDHKGIIINKEAVSGDMDIIPPNLSLEFKVFLTNAVNNTHTKESRQLRFWFKDDVSEPDQMRKAQEFFKELITPCEFPRDYVGFIKKIMKLMQIRYPSIRKIEVEIKQLEEYIEPPSRPVSMDDSSVGMKFEITQEKVLELIESAYPNPVSISDISKTSQSSEEIVYLHLTELISKGLIKHMENGNYTRVTQDDTEVKMVRQMPTVVSSQQPTIAIITAQYCEKLAVDAMIENKDTYVRYKTEGESNVYTLGNIGAHRVVSTKLPAVGHSRGAMIAAGNTTTRLLGTFQRVEYIFLVGVAGGVPHYTDYSKHVRLGDVVVSVAPEGLQEKFIYIYCENIKNSPEGNESSSNSPEKHSIKTWCPPCFELQMIAQQLWNQGLINPDNRPWENYIKEGLKSLQGQEAVFSRPPPDSDKLYMSIGGKDVIEVGHPQPPEGSVDYRHHNMPVIHFGAIGSGRMLMKDDSIRMEFANQYGLMAFDTEFDSVAESVFGNRKDNYIFIRGIADYKDGTKKKEWQPCAALAAAAFMKSIICALDPCDDD
ncbi:uncharacterized protein [Centruroides vittatus]|uniref:uncharacterized protein isoform X2 n=1 Tax=Centruroides vittatus TaxID=120091 RepID=UPI00350F5D34